VQPLVGPRSILSS